MLAGTLKSYSENVHEVSIIHNVSDLVNLTVIHQINHLISNVEQIRKIGTESLLKLFHESIDDNSY